MTRTTKLPTLTTLATTRTTRLPTLFLRARRPSPVPGPVEGHLGTGPRAAGPDHRPHNKNFPCYSSSSALFSAASGTLVCTLATLLLQDHQTELKNWNQEPKPCLVSNQNKFSTIYELWYCQIYIYILYLLYTCLIKLVIQRPLCIICSICGVACQFKWNCESFKSSDRAASCIRWPSYFTWPRAWRKNRLEGNRGTRGVYLFATGLITNGGLKLIGNVSQNILPTVGLLHILFVFKKRQRWEEKGWHHHL